MIMSFGKTSPLKGGRYSSLFLLIVGFLTFLTGCSSKPVVTVKNEAEAIQIVDVLREYELSSTKEEAAENNVREYKIFVHGDFLGGETANAAAYQILRAHCLPQSEPPVIESSGPISSPETERAKILRQQKMNIIAQLRSLPSATCVDVNFVMPQDPLQTTTPYPASAAVTVHYKNQEIPFNDADVRSLVASSVPNLNPNNVTVKLIYQPIAPPQRSRNGSLTRLLLIGGVGLVIILGSVFLVYYLRKRRQNGSTALAERPDEIDNAETVES